VAFRPKANTDSAKIDFRLDFPVGANASSCFASLGASICGSPSGFWFTCVVPQINEKSRHWIIRRDGSYALPNSKLLRIMGLLD
jgi:hypothetical protein